MYAETACFVGTGRHDSATLGAASDDKRFPFEGTIILLFDGSKKSIHIYMNYLPFAVHLGGKKVSRLKLGVGDFMLM